jgi:hypothetical protein
MEGVEGAFRFGAAINKNLQSNLVASIGPPVLQRNLPQPTTH